MLERLDNRQRRVVRVLDDMLAPYKGESTIRAAARRALACRARSSSKNLAEADFLATSSFC